MESMSKQEATKKHQEDVNSKKEKEDKRNLNYKKEGLLNEESWIHKFPTPTEKTIQLR